MRVYAVVSEQMSEEALELFVDRLMAELMVENRNRDEPDRAGEIHVEPVELETSVNSRAAFRDRSSVLLARLARKPVPLVGPEAKPGDHTLIALSPK